MGSQTAGEDPTIEKMDIKRRNVSVLFLFIIFSSTPPDSRELVHYRVKTLKSKNQCGVTGQAFPYPPSVLEKPQRLIIPKEVEGLSYACSVVMPSFRTAAAGTGTRPSKRKAKFGSNTSLFSIRIPNGPKTHFTIDRQPVRRRPRLGNETNFFLRLRLHARFLPRIDQAGQDRSDVPDQGQTYSPA